jgi:hypothetical protein
MPTLDQPMFCEGYCDKCTEYYYYVHIGEDPRSVTHACGQKISPAWRRLVVDSTRYTCPICTFTVYKEKDMEKSATFYVMDSKLFRHMCEVPLTKGAPPSGEPMHPSHKVKP